MEEKLSFKTTNEERAAGIEDEYEVLYSKDGKRLLECHNKSIEEYFVKEGTEVICDSGFWEREELKSIKLPVSLRHIGSFVFDHCPKLETIEFAHGLVSIGEKAFKGCESLTVLELPDSVKSLGDYVFSNCPNLVVVKFPHSLTSIGKDPFARSAMWESMGRIISLSKVYVTCPSDVDRSDVLEKFKKMLPAKYHDKLVVTDHLPDDWKKEKPTIQKPIIQYDQPVMMCGWGGDDATILLLAFDPEAFKDGYICIAIEDGYLELKVLTPKEFVEKNCSGLKFVDSFIRLDRHNAEDDMESNAPFNAPHIDSGMQYIFAKVDESAVKHTEFAIFDYLISGHAAGEFVVEVYSLTPDKENESHFVWNCLYWRSFCCK